MLGYICELLPRPSRQYEKEKKNSEAHNHHSKRRLSRQAPLKKKIKISYITAARVLDDDNHHIQISNRILD